MGEKHFSFGKHRLDLQAIQLSRREFLKYSLLAPIRMIHERDQDLSAQWEAVRSHLPQIAENIFALNESQNSLDT
jgi:hypothetical protein